MFSEKIFYLDYNATSPLSPSVKALLADDELVYANPSSQHSLGKKALKELNSVYVYLYDFFGINAQDFDLFFHSGATEGMNTIFQFNDDENFFYSVSDHPCVTENAKIHAHSNELFLTSNGHFDFEKNKKLLENFRNHNNWLNITWLHNEIGIVNNLDDIAKFKADTNAFIHVDGVQAIGKIPGHNYKLAPEVDAYTFSGHKFGALKGIGFSFIKKDILKPLIIGGGQQGGLRSGTVNIQGIISLKMALEDLKKDYALENSVKEFKTQIETIIKKNNHFFIIENESLNTIAFVHDNLKSDRLLTYFDMQGLCVSTGSACSSGSTLPSQTLLAMGLDDKAKNFIRISIHTDLLKNKVEILESLERVVSKIK